MHYATRFGHRTRPFTYLPHCPALAAYLMSRLNIDQVAELNILRVPYGLDIH